MESLTIKLNNIEDRYIPKEGLVYSTTVETATARYRPFGEYAVIGFWGGKYLAGYPEGKSNISAKSGIDPGRLHYILIDDDASYSLAMRSKLTLSEGYVLEIIDVNVTGTFVILSLKKDEIKVDTSTRKVEAGKNYIYETPDGVLIAVHIDSVFDGKEKASVVINGIFQISSGWEWDNLYEVNWVTNISDNTITMKNAADIVELKPRQIIYIDYIKLKTVFETLDGGFMAAGEYNVSDIRLVKIDKTGKEEWNRLFNSKGMGSNLGFGIISGENGTIAQTQDGGYVVAGINKWAAGDNLEAWLLKTDPDGNYSWSRILRGNMTGQNILSSVQETPGGFYVTGTWWNPYGGPHPDAVLLKNDQNGNEKWAWTRVKSINDHAGPGLQTSDGGFVMMGTSSYFNQSNWTDYTADHTADFTGPEWNTEIWLMKTDSQGNELWIKGNRVKKLAFEVSFSAAQDGGYIYSVIVQERPENDFETDIYGEIYSVKFVKLDPDGNIEWLKRDEGYSIKPTSDGGYVTARGGQLVKFGGARHEPLQPGIVSETSISAPTFVAVPNETQTATNIENAAGFEVVLVILMFLAAFISRRKIW
ncbi:MAG TPA: S-layer protein domain-containing protein [Candidatus Methanoperedens sp.]